MCIKVLTIGRIFLVSTVVASGEGGEEDREDYCSDFFLKVGEQYFYIISVMKA